MSEGRSTLNTNRDEEVKLPRPSTTSSVLPEPMKDTIITMSEIRRRMNNQENGPYTTCIKQLNKLDAGHRDLSM